MKMKTSMDAAKHGCERLGMRTGGYLLVGVDHDNEVTATWVMPQLPTQNDLETLGGLHFVVVHSVARDDDKPTPEERAAVWQLNEACEGRGLRLLDFVNIAESGWYSWADAGLLAPNGE